MDSHIPDACVRRLSAYMRQLQHLTTLGVERVSSHHLAEYIKVGAAQVRRDLALFGQFGRPGVGYKVEGLIDELRGILGTRRRWNVVVVGAGPLSNALLRYPAFSSRRFDLIAAFDVNPRKVGRRIGKTVVQSMDDLEAVLAANQVHLAILTVPPDAAQDAADRLVAAGIRGILNFAAPRLETPPGVHVNQVDIAAHLEQLTFLVTNNHC